LRTVFNSAKGALLRRWRWPAFPASSRSDNSVLDKKCRIRYYAAAAACAGA